MFVPFTRLGVVVLLVFLIVSWAAAGSRVDQFRECGSFPDRIVRSDVSSLFPF